MATMSKLIDVSSLVDLRSHLRTAQKDDLVFLVLLLLSGYFYSFYFKDKPDPYHHVWYEKPQVTDSNTKVETRDIAQKLEESKKDIVIFWGSQSGTAEILSNRLVRDFRSRFGLDALSADLQDYDPDSISNIPEAKFAIFIVSTYGEGDPSDNATNFISWLESNKSVRFSKLRYAAFGLGNKNYKFYNRVIDVVVKALDRFGATALMPTGRADDSKGGTDEDFIEWKQSLFSVFTKQLGFSERPQQYEPTLSIREDTSLDIIDLHVGEPIQASTTKKGASLTSPIHPLAIGSATKLLSTTNRNCLHVDLDTSDFPELKYKTGDHLAVWPSNPTSEMLRLVNILGLQSRLQTPLLISSLDPSIHVKVPSPTTWEALLQNYIEICAPVPRETVLALAQFAPSESSKATLIALGKNKDAYHEYCSNKHTTLGRLLEDISPSTGSWSQLPLSFLLENLSTLTPRYYSISSSSIVSPKHISITVATSSEPTASQNVPVPGLSTSYLLALEQQHQGATTSNASPFNLTGPSNVLSNGQKIFAHVRKSKFRLPTATKNPIIMIGSGSGIAPFRGFMAERARLATIGREVGPSLLFFGCRSPDEYLYQEELEDLESKNQGMEIVTAFSRTANAKCYVQDRIEQRQTDVVRLLSQENAYFYICGSASMARDVAQRLGECLKTQMGWDEARLREWSESMKRSQRWQEDVWG